MRRFERHARRKSEADEIASGRTRVLLDLARKMVARDAVLARRYVRLARRVAMRHRLKLGSGAFCKNCDTPFVPGVSVKTRVIRGTSVRICANCGKRAAGAARKRF